jgi:hypothetical protein
MPYACFTCGRVFDPVGPTVGLNCAKCQPPVCSVCNDTHRMELRDRDVMCTHCPTPCQDCRAGGNGPYCETTPCSCSCHRERKADVEYNATSTALLWFHERMRTLAHNLAAAGALCRAHSVAIDEAWRHAADRHREACDCWAPGCGRSAL